MTAPACQVANPSVELPCPHRESGGYRCEVTGPHTRHAISEHTIEHGLAGNGYACSALDPAPAVSRG